MINKSLIRFFLTFSPGLLSLMWASIANTAVDPVCGSPQPIECSAYLQKYERKGPIDPTRKYYYDKFHPACANHDYCYRFGKATYGYSKVQCDAQFLADMKEICTNLDWRSIASGGFSHIECNSMANTFHAAVVALGGSSYQSSGTTQCAYKGYCPPGNFSTTGRYRGCQCPVGNKIYTGIAKETAHCSNAVDCPSGTFSTTGPYRGCACPSGSKKKYLDPVSATATCTVDCPQGRFSTTGQYRGCKCPDDREKQYSGVGNMYAECTGYTAACPPGLFSTTGTFRSCACPAGSQKKYHGIGNSEAECEGHVAACPGGEFATTGVYRGCQCPSGSRKVYMDVANYKARCTVACPSGEFSTTGRYRGCACPEGKRKDYRGIGDYKAKCI